MSDVRLNVPPRLIESARAAQYANRESLGSRELEERIKKRTKIKALQQRKKNPLAQQEREGGQLEFERKENYKIWTRRRRPTGNGWLLAPTEGYTGDFIPVEAGGDFEQSTFATSDHKIINPLYLNIPFLYQPEPESWRIAVTDYASTWQRLISGNKFELVNNILLGSNVINGKPFYAAGFELNSYINPTIEGWSYEVSRDGSICYGILSYIYDKDSRIVALSDQNMEIRAASATTLGEGSGRISLVKANEESVSEVNPVLDAGNLKEWTLEIILEVPAVLPSFSENSFDPSDPYRDNVSTSEGPQSIFGLFGYDITGFRWTLFEIISNLEYVNNDLPLGWYIYGTANSLVKLTEAGGTFHVALQGKDNQTSFFVNGQKLDAIQSRNSFLAKLAAGISIRSAAYILRSRDEELYVGGLFASSTSYLKFSPAPSYCVGFHSLRFTPLAIYNEDGFEPPSRITSLYDT